jgi:hypothetical protein
MTILPLVEMHDLRLGDDRFAPGWLRSACWLAIEVVSVSPGFGVDVDAMAVLGKAVDQCDHAGGAWKH